MKQRPRGYAQRCANMFFLGCVIHGASSRSLKPIFLTMSEVAARQMFFRQMLFRALGLTAFGVLVCPQNNLWKGLNDDCAICGWDETDHFHLPRNFFRTIFKPSQVHSQVCYHGRQEDKVETREVTQVIILCTSHHSAFISSEDCCPFFRWSPKFCCRVE